MYTQKISADLSSSIYSRDWNMQIRQLLMLELQYICMLQATKSCIHTALGERGREEGNLPSAERRFRWALSPVSEAHVRTLVPQYWTVLKP